jgi:hypothetical protein
MRITVNNECSRKSRDLSRLAEQVLQEEFGALIFYLYKLRGQGHETASVSIWGRHGNLTFLRFPSFDQPLSTPNLV